MELEPFAGGDTLGRILLLQIKGRKIRMPSVNAELGLSISTSFIRYAERFVSPMVLVACPLTGKVPKTRFIWVQEYTRVRLPLDYPAGWRRKRTVTVKLPGVNQMPGARERLRYIANYPQRLESWGHLARLQNDLRLKARGGRLTVTAGGHPSAADFQEIRKLIRDAHRLPGLFLDKQNLLAQVTRNEAVRPALRAIRLLIGGAPYNAAAVGALDWGLVQPKGYAQTGNLEEDLLLRIEASGEQLSAYLSAATDVTLRQIAWQQMNSFEW